MAAIADRTTFDRARGNASGRPASAPTAAIAECRQEDVLKRFHGASGLEPTIGTSPASRHAGGIVPAKGLGEGRGRSGGHHVERGRYFHLPAICQPGARLARFASHHAGWSDGPRATRHSTPSVDCLIEYP